jgi:hypothetical protein
MNATKRDAIAKARAAGESRVLVELDHQDTRRTCVVRPEYLDDPEFEAFDGRIIGWAYANGDWDHDSRY